MSYRGEEVKSSPIESYINWKGKKSLGKFMHYVSPENEGEEGKNVDWNLQSIIIIKLGYIVGGFDEKEDSYFKSNEITDLRKERFIVRYQSSGNEITEDFWTYCKENLGSKGARLFRTVTAYDVANDKFIRFGLKGTAFYALEQMIGKGAKDGLSKTSHYIDFKGKGELITEKKDRKTGKVKKLEEGFNHYLPQFAFGKELTEEHIDTKVKPFLQEIKEYEEYVQNKYGSGYVEDEEVASDPMEDNPFDKASDKIKEDNKTEDYEDLPF